MLSKRLKLEVLKNYARLFSHWEMEFVRHVWDGISGTPQFIHDAALEEYLSENQMQKIEEIWKTYSPHLNKTTPKTM